jgi:deoxyribonuclease-4
MKLGFHLSIKGGYAAAIDRAVSLRCECLQIFSRSPRSWGGRAVSSAEAALFRERRRASGIDPCFSHASYLLNLSAKDEDLLEKSRAALSDELARAAALGLQGVVVHMGTRGEQSEQTALEVMAESVGLALACSPAETSLLLENTCGGGGQTGYRFEQLAALFRLLTDSPRLGLCLDTAHAFAAGYDLASPRGLKTALGELDRHVGLERLRIVHLNDSLSPLGSRRDRHAHLGKGRIGRRGIKALLRHPFLAGVPAIMETPKKNDGDDRRNMRRARRWRDGLIASLFS